MLHYFVSYCCWQTQVCVQQTALDLVAKGYDVHVVADAVSSRTLVDRMFAFEVSSRLAHMSPLALFQWMT